MKKMSLVITILLVLTACSKKRSSDSPAPAPGKAILMSPDSNSTCTVGSILSATQNAVTFVWNSSSNTTTYDLYTKNLLTGAISTQSTAATQLAVTLSRNTPYSWYVVSRSSQSTVTTSSSTWKFYNSGVAITSHAPFPADLSAPTLGQNISAVSGKVTLTWTGSDVDNDIAGYDVYLGTSATNLTLVQSGVIAATYSASVTSGNTYFWKVITKDSAGNDSTSGIYQFTVN